MRNGGASSSQSGVVAHAGSVEMYIMEVVAATRYLQSLRSFRNEDEFWSLFIYLFFRLLAFCFGLLKKKLGLYP